MLITWRDKSAPAPTPGPEDRAVTATSGDFPDTDLEAGLYAAARALGADLARQGAAPPHIRSLTIQTPDPAAFEAMLPALDLMYREALGGNFGQVALLAGDSLTLTANALVPPESKEIVFGSYTAAELSFQYSPRATVSDAADIMARWRVEGSAWQKSRTAELHYGTKPSQTLDIYIPDGVKSPPLHVYIHGGYWQALDKRDNGHLCAELVKAGVAVAVLNYSLCPPGTISDIITECREALKLLHGIAGEYGCDRDRITASGHSAGGHLVAMLASTHWPQIDPDLPRDLIKGVVSISGLFDLEPLRHTGLNNALGLTEETARQSSPVFLNLVATGPFIAAVGGDESDEFRRQSRDYADHWADRRKDIRYLECPGLNHFTIADSLADPESELFQAVLAQVQG